MIVRVLGEGQFEVPTGVLDRLNRLDADVEAAIEGGDEDAFRTALEALVAAVHESGTPTDPASLLTSDVILPPADASMAEVRDLLSADGLIPD